FVHSAGSVLVSGCYLLVALTFSHELGLGDVRLGGLLGGFLAYLGWTTLIDGVACPWLLAAVFVIVGPGRHRGARWRGATIPLAPFLILGALVAIVAS
ncbi:MAG: pilD, partial [Acidimicrobiaceae bacterium]|nr:pilD [Acidimicrobiaceae bacterium]